jgi:hypothetical protein
MAAMAKMSDATKLRHTLEVNMAVIMAAFLLAVMSGGLYLWKPSSFQFGMVCIWLSVGSSATLLYHARKKKLKALDPD